MDAAPFSPAFPFAPSICVCVCGLGDFGLFVYKRQSISASLRKLFKSIVKKFLTSFPQPRPTFVDSVWLCFCFIFAAKIEI